MARENEIKENRKKNNENRNKGRVFLRILLIVLIVIGLIYVIFLFVTTNFMGTDNLVTEITNKTVAADTISSDCFILRDEEIIDNDTHGSLVYSVDDSEKIKVGGLIATSYQSQQDVSNNNEIRDIDDKITYLKALSASTNSVNVGVDSVNDQLDSQMITFINNLNKGNLKNMSSVEDELMQLIYRKQIIVGEQGSFNQIIANLTRKKNQLKEESNPPIGEIIAKSAGYFVSSLDGYENALDISKLDTITYNQYKTIKQKDVSKNDAVGKIIKGVNWYIACPINKDNKNTIERNKTEIQVQFPFASNSVMPAHVVTINSGNTEDENLLILSCNYMNNSLAELRNEQVDILISSFEGLKVSKKALHDDYCTRTVYNEDGTKTTKKEKTVGVYVSYGNELVFKPVYIIHSADDYVICEENPDPSTSYDQSTLALYDQVVVEGSDLYNGKILQ